VQELYFWKFPLKKILISKTYYFLFDLKLKIIENSHGALTLRQTVPKMCQVFGHCSLVFLTVDFGVNRVPLSSYTSNETWQMRDWHLCFSFVTYQVKISIQSRRFVLVFFILFSQTLRLNIKFDPNLSHSFQLIIHYDLIIQYHIV